ncbi:MAG: hypothetical protein GEU90_14980 [Gemmatimonas sp.]|nr:hypothetical protein [Gemmatimonas sp.]
MGFRLRPHRPAERRPCPDRDGARSGLRCDYGDGIPVATVELAGHGSTLTSEDGSFRFVGVEAGSYTFRTTAFGYIPESSLLVVRDDVTLSVPLEPAPLVLDSVGVNIERIDVGGRVRDPEKEFFLVDATILTDQAVMARTDSHGRFRLRGVLERAPLTVRVRAFGYLPVDSIVLPTEDDRYLFELVEDSAVTALIARQIERLEERAAPRFAPLFRNMNRDRLLRFTGSHTLRSILEFEYWPHLHRIRAVIVDGRRYSMTDDPVAELSHILPEELERIEFFSAGRSAVVLVVYTRQFMRDLIARQIQ